MKSPALISVFLLGLVCLCGAAHADMVTITSDRDSGIYAASSDLANGAGPSFLVGKTGSNGITRALMRFDVAGTVPDGATVNSAALTLRMIQTRAPATDVSLHRVLKDWGEGTSSATGCCGSGVGAGDPSTPGDATWEHTFFDSDLWTTPGGDFAPTASATANVGLVGSYTWGSTAQLAADVQSWLDDPANNFGWIAIGGEAPVLDSLGKVFGSHQNGTAANRPALEIDFDLPVLTPGDANGDGVVDVADLGIVG